MNLRMKSVSVKRIYEPEDATDGVRLLVDGLWPRGVRREQVPEGKWMRAVAPSDDLRKWYGHDEKRFEEFASRYREELDSNRAVEDLMDIGDHLTLLTAVKDIETSHAAVLRDYLIDLIALSR